MAGVAYALPLPARREGLGVGASPEKTPLLTDVPTPNPSLRAGRGAK
jgi:hypothetical protein